MCKYVTGEGLVEANSMTLGNNYLDLVRVPDFQKLVQKSGRTFSRVENKHITLTFDFQDWKWLSKPMRFVQKISDPDIIFGQKEGEIEVDFNKIRESDLTGNTRFEVAGRVFYEVHVFGYKLTSFTSSGFLEREGYTVPPLSSSKIRFVLENKELILAGTFVLVIIFAWWVES